MSNPADFDALWDYDHADQTEHAFRDLLPQLEGDLAAQLLTQIARAQGLQGQFEQGHATLDQAEQQITSATQTARVRLLLERGRLFNSAGQPDQARPLFERAWELGQQIGEIGYAVDAGHMLGILEAPALDWSLKTAALAESSSDPRARRWLGSLYNNIGWTYHDRGDDALALATFERALALR
ncbi:MAG TPA: tetratricopeptide repeat protein [Phototrophicaceae bacterium]|nr:tetratricopeptide repeat protein [Phototrophicaceae bacterium]